MTQLYFIFPSGDGSFLSCLCITLGQSQQGFRYTPVVSSGLRRSWGLLNNWHIILVVVGVNVVLTPFLFKVLAIRSFTFRINGNIAVGDVVTYLIQLVCSPLGLVAHKVSLCEYPFVNRVERRCSNSPICTSFANSIALWAKILMPECFCAELWFDPSCMHLFSIDVSV